MFGGAEKRGKDGESQLQRLGRDAQKVAVEHLKGISSQVLKTLLFSRRHPCRAYAQGAAEGEMETA